MDFMKWLLELILNSMCGPDAFNGMYETLSVNLFSSGGRFAPVLSLIRALYNIAMPIGVMLVVIYFTIALIDSLACETFTWERMAKQFVQLIVAKFLMENGFEILELIFGVGMQILSRFSAVSGTDVAGLTIDIDLMITNFRDSLGFLGKSEMIASFIMLVMLLIPFALSWIMNLCVSIICYSRVIMIYVKAAFAPIALSDFFYTGLQGGGWKYLKDFLATALQGAIILVVAMIYAKLFQTITADSGWHIIKFLGTYLAFYASAIMLMFKSLPLAEKLVGVN